MENYLFIISILGIIISGLFIICGCIDYKLIHALFCCSCKRCWCWKKPQESNYLLDGQEFSKQRNNTGRCCCCIIDYQN